MNDNQDEPDTARRAPGNAFDASDGYSGQDYHIDRERAEGERNPSGGRPPASGGGDAAAKDTPDIPPDNGRRAAFDPANGEVHGAGSGAGGGNPGEDFDSDSASGDGYQQTGKS